MVVIRIAIAVFSVVAVPATVVAQTPASEIQSPLRSGVILRTADGRRLGQIERVEQGTAGAEGAVSVVYNGHFVHVPVSTVSVVDKGAVTSLTLADVRKLN